MKRAVLYTICAAGIVTFACLVYLRSSLMTIAVAADNHKLVETFLKLGVSPNSKIDGVPALTFAVSTTCKYRMTSLLLTYGADPVRKEPETEEHYKSALPVLAAAETGSIPCVQLLLEHGADIQVTNTLGLGAAYYAVLSGNVELLQLVISLGVPFDQPGKQGNTPLSGAAASGDEEMIKFLLSSGAVECRRDSRGKTAKDKALASKNPESSELFSKDCSSSVTMFLGSPSRLRSKRLEELLVAAPSL